MAKKNGKAREVSLGERGAIALKVNGIILEVSADGSGVKIISDRHVEVGLAGNANAPKTETALAAGRKALEIGDMAKDGCIYAGISEDPASPRYEEPLWVAPRDAGIMTWNQADTKSSKIRRAEGDDGIGLPTKGELSQIYNNLVEKGIGGFDRSGKHPTSDYWAADPTGYYTAAYLRMSDGKQKSFTRNHRCSVRYVHGGPVPD
ncbi:MAG: hypothetical protein V1721_07180 [Pseudomonadota bacterium]